MTMQQSRRRILGGLAVFLLGSPAGIPVMARAQGKGSGSGSGSDRAGDTDRDRLREHQTDMTGDRDRLMDQDRLHDMDQLRDRLHQTENGPERERLLNRYRERLDQAMSRLDQMPTPDAGLSEAQRLRHLEQRDAMMQQLMRHMWSYQNAVRGDLGG